MLRPYLLAIDNYAHIYFFIDFMFASLSGADGFVFYY